MTEVKANARKITAKRENDAIKGEKNNYEMQNDHRVVKKMTAGGCKTYSFELRWYYSILSFSGSYLYYVVQYHLCQSNYINIVL